MMIKYNEVTTWEDLLKILQEASPEQLEQPIQVVKASPMWDHVHECHMGICIGTVDDLDLRYVRSVSDNRRNGDELVLYVDGNPHAKDGAIGYEWSVDEEIKSVDDLGNNPIYPQGHNDSSNWTGPAQVLTDMGFKEKDQQRGEDDFSPAEMSQIRKCAKEAHRLSGEIKEPDV